MTDPVHRSEFGGPEGEERFAAEHPEEHMRRREFLTKTAMLAGAAGLATALPARALISQAASVQTAPPLPSPSNMPIDTFVVLMQENRSFDHYFGWRADADAKNQLSYPDNNGQLHATHKLAPDFQGCAFEDPDHSWEGGRTQYDNGAMDGFRKSPNDQFAIGYYERKDIPYSPLLADQATLYDRYFCSLLGPTWPNREYMHSAQSGGVMTNADPQDAVTGIHQQGLYRWLTIWDLMLSQGLSVTYYFSDLPFIGIFGQRYSTIIKPVAQFYVDAAAGNLPNLAFVDPMFLDGGGGNGLSGDEHPHGDIRIGQAFQSDIVHAFVTSPQFRTGALFINYDEWGGFFDHVPPVLVPDDLQDPDLSKNFGITGFRIPGIAVSPYARRGYVSHQTVTHESILKLLSYRFGLGYLNKRHRYASNIGRSFDWENPNFNPPDLPIIPPPITTPCSLQGVLPGGKTTTSGTDAAAERAEKSEGLHIGSPEMLEYFEALGFPHGPAKPEDIFSSPSSTVERLGRQIEALGGTG
ncbi:MAG: alkaline phosphatase family protein [Solirubrobacterales bacterium]